MKIACIIGAGPAGLTAAYELLTKTDDIILVIIEQDNCVGGISRTVNYKGNRMDIGGHRFFSKNQAVNDFWDRILPMESAQLCSKTTDKIMLTRSRLSRIMFLKKMYDYPLSLNYKTLSNLGPKRLVKIGSAYLYASVNPIKPEKTLEDFFVNRFGRELYQTFFRDYTHKVWGVPCEEIPKDWGAQRVKGVSVSKAITHALKNILSINNKNVETSLIEEFKYPKFGPGQLWEEVAELVKAKGGQIYFGQQVTAINYFGNIIKSVKITAADGTTKDVLADYFLSTMPVQDFIKGMQDVPKEVRHVAEGLVYRDFITLGVLLGNSLQKDFKDNWIYVQEPELQMGRIQIFNNWSPYMVADQSKQWLGLEYFCKENDAMWLMSDEKIQELAAKELKYMGFIKTITDIEDITVIRVKKAYPAYFGTYNKFQIVRDYLNSFENLYPIGRNGMHRYNNMDHSMLTAMLAAELIKNKTADKSVLWDVNSEDDYHESK